MKPILEIFLKKIVKKIWGIEFDQISIVNLIKNEYCRKHLEKAEKYYQSKDHEKSAQYAMSSLKHAIDYVQNAIAGSKPAFESIASIDSRGEVKEGRSYERVFEKMRETYYRIAGWDPQSGIPTEAKLRELDLDKKI